MPPHSYGNSHAMCLISHTVLPADQPDDIPAFTTANVLDLATLDVHKVEFA